LLNSGAAYALAPGLRRIESKENIDLEIRFSSVPRFEFESVTDKTVASDARALIRVVLSGVELNLRKESAGQSFDHRHASCRFGQDECRPVCESPGWDLIPARRESMEGLLEGLEFDEDPRGRHAPGGDLREDLRDELRPGVDAHAASRKHRVRPAASFAVNDGYLLIGLGEPPPLGAESELPKTAKRNRYPSRVTLTKLRDDRRRRDRRRAGEIGPILP
jgi:hypothetical protein